MEFYLVIKSALSFYIFLIFKADSVMAKHTEITNSAGNQIIQVQLLSYYCILSKDDLFKKFKNQFLKHNSKTTL